MTFNELAAVIKWHRKQAKLSQSELALLAGVGKTVVFDIEHGKHTVRVDKLLQVCGALQIELSWKSRLDHEFAKDSGK
jgi:HTH-type transcriptional regulator / antitoxin HipB